MLHKRVNSLIPPTTPTPLFLDGQRFLTMKEGEEPETSPSVNEPIVVLNWFEKLKRLTQNGNSTMCQLIPPLFHDPTSTLRPSAVAYTLRHSIVAVKTDAFERMTLLVGEANGTQGSSGLNADSPW